MNKKLATIMLLFSLVSLVWSQQKMVVKRNTIKGDSTQIIVSIDHDFDINVDDSTHAMVFVQRNPVIEEQVARIVIKKTGLFRKNKIVIDFDPTTQRIVKVMDDDKEVPEKKFHKYQEYLEDATEFSELEDLHPKMEELEYKIQMMELPNSQKLADLNELIIDLEGLKSEHAILKKQQFNSIIQVIKLDHLEEKIQEALEAGGMSPPQKIEKISIEDGKFFVNGQEIEGDLGKKCIQIYAGMSDIPVEDLDVHHKWNDEDIRVQIIFD